MIGVPAGWPRAASGTHAPLWRADILTAAGDLLVGSLPVVGGQITCAERTYPRHECNVDVPTGAVPGLLDQSYLPTGGRLRLQFSIGGREWATMADLDLVESTIARPEDMWTMAAVDASARIARDDLARGTPATFTGTVAAAITAVARRTFPNMQTAITGPALTQPAAEREPVTDGDPWRLIEELAAEAGSEVFVHRTTRALVVRPIPATGTPADTLGVGAQGVLTGYVVKHAMAPNTVAQLYLSRATGTVLRRGLAVDTRPDSPVAVQRVGSNITLAQVLRVDTAPTQQQADQAAAQRLAREGGRARAAEVRHPTRPWLEPGDTVELTFLGGPTEAQVVESVGIDLGPANIQVTRFRNDDYRLGALLP